MKKTCYSIVMPLYAFGSNGSGQLGVGHRDDLSRPTLHRSQHSNKEAQPLLVKGGGNHSIIIYSPGEVAVCGKVLVELQPETCLESIPLNLQAKFCSANWDTVITCTESLSSLTAWGCAEKGELANNTMSKEVPFCNVKPLEWPRHNHQHESNFHVVDLASGLYHTVVVLSNGDVWGWGANRKGQLGEPKVNWVALPKRISRNQIGFNVKRAVCGREFTYLVGSSVEGRHVVLGGNGTNAKLNVTNKAPKAVPGWKDIGANWGGIVVLFHSGKVISWGRADHGQMRPDNLPLIQKIAVGSEHTLAIDIHDRVLAWGWGEHGNCGPNVDDQGDVKGRWAVIEMPDKAENIVEGIGAGCATSWIWTKPRQEKPLSTLVAWQAGDDGQFPPSAPPSDSGYMMSEEPTPIREIGL